MKQKMQTINEHIGKTNVHKVRKQFTTEKRDVLVVVIYKKNPKDLQNYIYFTYCRNISLMSLT